MAAFGIDQHCIHADEVIDLLDRIEHVLGGVY